MINRIKIAICLITITVIAGIIGYFFADYKMDQMRKLFLREKLMKMEGQLRELGLRLCIIQSDASSNALARGHMIALLDFDEKDFQQIKTNIDKIEAIINEYVRTENEDRQLLAIRFLDADGFNLENTLKGQLDLKVDETDAEYYSVIREYNNKLSDELWEALDAPGIDRNSLSFKILSDVVYDVTLEIYKVKKQYFYARFRNLDKEKLQDARIIYKKVGSFDLSRGDKIYFYNLSDGEFKLINKMVGMRKKITSSTKIIYLDEMIK